MGDSSRTDDATAGLSSLLADISEQAALLPSMSCASRTAIADAEFAARNLLFALKSIPATVPTVVTRSFSLSDAAPCKSAPITQSSWPPTLESGCKTAIGRSSSLKQLAPLTSSQRGMSSRTLQLQLQPPVTPPRPQIELALSLRTTESMRRGEGRRWSDSATFSSSQSPL
eukprot:m51a1_g3850 hypothetical protein (171) ;mRNA; r:382693-383302